MSNNTLSAAARRFTKELNKDKKTKGAASTSGKQSQAWTYWDDTPEVRFASTWIGNSMGRARLFAGRRMSDGSVDPLPAEHRASELVAQIAGGPTGQSELLTEFGPHLVVAGEGWIVIEYTAFGEEWHVLSTSEVTGSKSGDSLEVVIEDRKVTVPGYDPDATPDPSDTSPLAVRVWNPHPRRHSAADSAIFSSFALLDELRLLNAAVAAIAKSRLTGRGIIFVPEGSKFPSADGGEDEDFTELLMSVAATAYGDPDSAAAAVPIIVEVPANSQSGIERLTFESDFDDLAVKLREETIRRFAANLDTPAEILLGTAGVNHWGQWSIEESAIRTAIEPKLGLIANALTGQWLRPALESEGHEDANDVLVWYDTSELRVRTNRHQTAMELYDRNEISGDALRRETGFDDGDAPNIEDRERGLLTRLVQGAPSLAPVILPLLGIELAPGGVEESMSFEITEGGDALPPVVEIPVGEDNSLPDGENMGTDDEGLFAAVDGLVWRALERAGQRLRSRQPRATRGGLQEVEASAAHCILSVDEHEIDSLGLLDGAWTRVPEVAARYDIPAQVLEEQLNEYVRGILVNGVEHTWTLARAVGQSTRLRVVS